MAEDSIFHDQYSDRDYSEPESDASDIEPDGPDSDIEPVTPDVEIPDAAANPQVLGPVANNVKKILAVITGLGFTVSTFLDALSWGDRDCTIDPIIRRARRDLFESPQLPMILRRWHKPPRPPKSKKARPQGARAAMEKFALECSQEILGRELESLAQFFHSPIGEDIKEEHLTGISFRDMVRRVKTAAPNLWEALFRLARTESQQERNPHKSPANVSV